MNDLMLDLLFTLIWLEEKHEIEVDLLIGVCSPQRKLRSGSCRQEKNACQKNGYKMDFYCTLETGYLYAEILVFCLHVFLSFFVFMFSYLGLEVIVSIQTCLISYLLFQIVRFQDKESHQIFLEPEGRTVPELYVQVRLNFAFPDLLYQQVKVPSVNVYHLLKLNQNNHFNLFGLMEISLVFANFVLRSVWLRSTGRVPQLLNFVSVLRMSLRLYSTVTSSFLSSTAFIYYLIQHHMDKTLTLTT